MNAELHVNGQFYIVLTKISSAAKESPQNLSVTRRTFLTNTTSFHFNDCEYGIQVMSISLIMKHTSRLCGFMLTQKNLVKFSQDFSE